MRILSLAWILIGGWAGCVELSPFAPADSNVDLISVADGRRADAARDARPAPGDRGMASGDGTAMDDRGADTGAPDVAAPSCAPNTADCNGDPEDDCETTLGTVDHCGGCNKACPTRAHAVRTCTGGKCGYSCSGDYKDCNGNASDGCEIPVGVPNRCDKGGLNANNGCGTAYCGSSSMVGAKNFGSWTCVFCDHCHQFSDGFSWCLYAGASPGRFSNVRCSACCLAKDRDRVCAK